MIGPSHTITRYARNGMVACIDHLASGAGVAMLRNGGNAVDAAIAANAVLAVTNLHQCGPGGDLFAMVHRHGEPPRVLNSSGRSGSGADPDELRAQGYSGMPFKRHIASVPVPGCVDGWLTLHTEYGRLPFADVMQPAIVTALRGFSLAPHLAPAIEQVVDVDGVDELLSSVGSPASAGALIRRPGLARTLQAIVTQGRDGFYGGEFGEALLELGAGQYTSADLETSNADWVDAVSREIWGHRVWTVPPNSQGYLTLLSAAIAEGLDLPEDPAEGQWVHLLVEAARAAAYDRLSRLHEHAEPTGLVADHEVARRQKAIDNARRARWSGAPGVDGDTIYLCAVDSDRMGVSLIQSNAAGFGSELVAGSTGIFLHNRGNGFSLVPGHPAEYGPGRRPPHTLAPATISAPDGSLHAVLGTMGGDSQPQILLQLITRMLCTSASAGEIIAAPRFVLAPPDPNGFDTWTEPDAVRVMLDGHAPDTWVTGLEQRGHDVERTKRWNYGHAHMIRTGELLEGAAEPRVGTGDAAGW